MVKQEIQRKHTPSMEDYLEAIAMLRGAGKVVRVNQISQMLKVRMPSVTSALKKLSEQGLVMHERYGYVELTTVGYKAAKDVIRRHKALSRFFAEALDIDQETAEKDACRIEHVISPLSLERVIKFIEFIEACPLGEPNFPKRYKYYLEHGELPEECEECLEKNLKKRE
ncbi:MAG: metal-dependent transcriptional regulator [Dehalococcoidia bacterium]|nr:metal-dependent transcriptional regulator [Dehalococcoidia bacterium]